MSQTDPAGHALLSDAAHDLEANNYDAFQQQTELAEDLLGVGNLTLSDSDDLAVATRAVVRQLNAQIAYGAAADEGGVLKREKKGDQEREWAVSVGGSITDTPIDAIAQQLIQSLDVSSGWSTVTSLRG